MTLWTVRGTPLHEDAIDAFLDGYGYLVLEGAIVELYCVTDTTEDAWRWACGPVEYEGEA